MTRNPRQARFRHELKRLLKRGVPAAKAMKQAWRRVPKNPRRHRNPSGDKRAPGGRCVRCGQPTVYKGGVCRWCQAMEKKNPRRLTRAKARKILHEGRARGHELTPAQRGLFGAVASGSTLRDYPRLNPPPIQVLANGRLVGLIGFRPTRGRKVARNPRIDIRV